MVLVLMMIMTIIPINNAYGDEILKIENFTDIISNHWGIETIRWGLEKKMLTGYPDNLFKPDNMITEGEFAVILTKYAENVSSENIVALEGEHWSQSYYDELKQFELPLNGYDNDVIKDAPITRGQIASTISAKYGFNLGEQQAVYFLYENELSQGRTEKNYEGYSPNAYLTRAEIVQFFKNVDNQGTRTLTFLGKQSVKGACDADTIVGIEGVALDTTPVDFTKWASEVDLSGKISTKVENGKVVAIMDKITTPITVEGKRNKFINYFNFDTNGRPTVGSLNNSIIMYGGVELPYSGEFRFPDMLIKNDGVTTGLVGIELDGNGIAKVSAFNNKEAFKSLMSNLSYFEASSAQIERARELVDEWTGKYSDDSGNDKFYTLRSTLKDSALLVIVGDGAVNIGMYKGAQSIYLGAIEVVD